MRIFDKKVMVAFVCVAVACGASSSTPSPSDDAGGDDDTDAAAADAQPDDSAADAALDSAADSAPDAPSDCPSCKAVSYNCDVTGMASGTTTLAGTKNPDGSCSLGLLMLACGGTGTGGNGAALMWQAQGQRESTFRSPR